MYSAIHSLPLDVQGSLDGTNLPGDACLVLTSDPKPRLRWTAELHERFVDAVTQLGGPDMPVPPIGLARATVYFCHDHYHHAASMWELLHHFVMMTIVAYIVTTYH
uniref:Uncharacterized protein n=1 Tax=Quercus lobata TaxID=97700 RepID=A0A7N2LY27_QUELO